MEKKQNELSLRNLDSYGMDDEKCRAKLKASRQVREQYKRRYGAQWFKHYAMDKGMMPDYDMTLKLTNEAIYLGREPSFIGHTPRLKMCRELYAKRTHDLYGDDYDELVHHDRGDARVSRLLLQDAVKTGKWRELPDELQVEYKRFVGGDLT